MGQYRSFQFCFLSLISGPFREVKTSRFGKCRLPRLRGQEFLYGCRLPGRGSLTILRWLGRLRFGRGSRERRQNEILDVDTGGPSPR